MDLTTVSIFITAIATCVIAVYSVISSNLAKEIKNQTRQHQSDLSDLYQAIVIATLMGGSSNQGVARDLIKTFNAHYQGKVKIFKSER
jgi:K+-sensing histidine kinase KdpD